MQKESANNNNSSSINKDISVLIGIFGKDNVEIIQQQSKILKLKIKIHQKVTIEFDLRKYPKKVKVQIPSELAKIIGKPEKFLDTLIKWDPKKDASIIPIVVEFNNFIAMHGSGRVLISKDLMKGILKWANDYYPEEVLGLLRKRNGVVAEFILPPGFDSSPTMAIFSPNMLPIDTSIVGSVHSHPSGNITPSGADKAMFSRYPLNIIVGPPFNFNCIGCYDREGKPIEFMLV
ncbi:MAG: Mov34/MPN/PAD-1 family protein [Promethearchaeota archaeon]